MLFSEACDVADPKEVDDVEAGKLDVVGLAGFAPTMGVAVVSIGLMVGWRDSDCMKSQTSLAYLADFELKVMSKDDRESRRQRSLLHLPRTLNLIVLHAERD